jgi:hypothetical protein
LIGNIPLDISCHAQANAYILSSFGGTECNFSLTSPAYWKGISYIDQADLLFTILFSLLGYGFLIYNFRVEEKEKRKYFLGLVLLFVSCAYLVILPVVGIQFRYFLPTVLVPFLFLGFFLDYLARKNFKKFMPFLVLIFLLPLATNCLSIQAAAKELLSHMRNGKDHIVLGETETMANYIIAHTPDNQRKAYLLTSRFSVNCIKPLEFVAEERQFEIVRADSVDHIPQGEQAFYIQNSEGGDNGTSDKFMVSKNFGQETLYQLQN